MSKQLLNQLQLALKYINTLSALTCYWPCLKVFLITMAFQEINAKYRLDTRGM